MPARSPQAASFFRLPCQVLAFRNLRLLTRPPGAALLPQDEWKEAEETAPQIFFLGESFSLRQTSSGRDAMMPHRGTCNGTNGETDEATVAGCSLPTKPHCRQVSSAAKDINELMQLQSEFLRNQFGTATEQFKLMTSGAAYSADYDMEQPA